MTVAEQLQNWQPGHQPLPEPFERQALRMFSIDHPMAAWGDPVWSATRNAYRAEVRRSALETSAHVWLLPSVAEHSDRRWRDSFFATMLAEVTSQHVYGQPLSGLVPLVRADIKGYAESYTEDAVERYAGILNAVRSSKEVA